jgi:hypothetical protein
MFVEVAPDRLDQISAFKATRSLQVGERPKIIKHASEIDNTGMLFWICWHSDVEQQAVRNHPISANVRQQWGKTADRVTAPPNDEDCRCRGSA